MKKRPEILTIAGFDPTGGAGVLADCKTFERHKCLGMAVITANTVQTEDTFMSINWINEEIVLKQLEGLLKNYRFKYVKIGMVPSVMFLQKVIITLKQQLPTCQIVWDPVLSASAGADFNVDLDELTTVLDAVTIITPNWDEICNLTTENDALKAAEILQKYTTVYLKGGHNPQQEGKDYLYLKNGKIYPLNPKPKRKIYSKHGSGCVLASALTANLAKGYPVLKASLRAKRYVEKFLSSNPFLLGYHYE